MADKNNNDQFQNESDNVEESLNESHNIIEDKEAQEYIYDEEYIKEEIPEDIYITNAKESDNSRKKKKKKRKFRGSLLSYIALALVAAIIGGVASTYISPMLVGNILPYPKGQNINNTDNIVINTKDDVTVTNAVAKKGLNSVVGITSLETRQYLFQQQDVQGVGSGVIVDSRGYILTNSHVVADGKAKELKVLFGDGEKTDAKVLWNDPILDLAVIKVDYINLPVADLGDSDNLEIGDIAVAIGNPLGLEFQKTVTSGIISGLHRSVRVDEMTIIDDLIQTDASINPGNSGGPLLNSKGEVIGINTAKIGSAEGLGFSIPINKAKPIIKEVIETGTFESVALEVTGMHVLEFQARAGVDLGLEEGIYVLNTKENGPADKAGIKPGDIIVKIDNKELDSLQTLKKELYNYSKGDSVELTILRGHEEIKVQVTF